MKASNLLNTLRVYIKNLISALPAIGLLALVILSVVNAKLPIEWDRVLSPGEIDDLLRKDLRRFELGVLRLLGTVQPNQSEFDALVSFSFNLGLGCFQRSTVRSAFIRGDKKRSGEVLLKYRLAGGRILPGLVRRRQAELALLMR
jgi:GH24 family phage-related lysozyme (muramidase)